MHGSSGSLSSPQIIDCKFTDNDAWRGAGAHVGQYGDADFKNCVFQNNTADSAGGLSIGQSHPTLTDCRFIGNELTGAGLGHGGAISIGDGLEFGDPLQFIRCVFQNNDAGKQGGAIRIGAVGLPVVLDNCLFYRNDASSVTTTGQGGAIYAARNMNITNCTFAENTAGAPDGGGGIYSKIHLASGERSSHIDNTILWGNTANADNSDEADQMKAVFTGLGTGSMEVFNTCIEDLDPNGEWNDESNTDEDPLFDSPAVDDYHLDPVNCGFDSCDSKSIDRGEDDETDCLGVDLEGNDRCVDLDNLPDEVDMGALETQSGP